MTDVPQPDHVDDLAKRAEELIDRRSMLASASRKLAVPVLVTYVCSRDAMGQTGSPGPSGTTDKPKPNWRRWWRWWRRHRRRR